MRHILRAAVVAAVLAPLAIPALSNAQPANPTQARPPRVPPPPQAGPTDQAPLDMSEIELLTEIEDDYRRYTEAAERHRERMRAILKGEFDERRRTLEKRYDERIARAERERRRRHLEAVALLEKFIKEHPNQPQFTPDAMFRLADLYLDEAEWELERIEEEGNFDEEPIADYSRAIALWDEIIEKFPDYRQLPGTIYLRAHYGKIEDERKSLQLFLSLVCANKYSPSGEPPPMMTEAEVRQRYDQRALANPYADCVPMKDADPELLNHAWIRGVGDHHFNVPGELDEAIAAYNKVAGSPEAELYPESLYKLAWSYYRRDYLLDAIKNFDKSVVLYDELVARGEQPKLELRQEALQYIAVSFTDPWEGELETDPDKALARAKEFYAGRQDDPHMRDVWEALGRALLELQAYDQAVDVFYTAIAEPWHLHPNNPVLHQEIVNALEAKGDKYAADEAAAELATRYAPGSAWYTANATDREAMENYRRIGERMLYAAARNMHAAASRTREEAEATKDPAKMAEAMKLYARAIELYQSFIEQYPESEYTYDFTFAMAEAMLFSDRHLDAIEHYRWVRDHRDLNEKYFQDSARRIIQALEIEEKKQIAAGQVQPLNVPTAEQLKALPQPIQPQQIPEIHQRLQKAWDEYQQLVNDPKTAPEMGINAGRVSLAYYHLDDALARFEQVFSKFCGTEAAVKAKDAMLVIHDARGEEEKFQDLNQRFIAQQCGDTESIELAKSQNRSIEFRQAERMLEQRQYEAAAREFYGYYKRAPEGDKDLPTALYNAAYAYGLAGKPKTSIHLYKEFINNDSPLYKQSPYYLEALRLTGRSYQNTYDYDNAVKTYMSLYDEASNAKRRGYQPHPDSAAEGEAYFKQTALEGLFNAAVNLELDRDFDQAVRRYRQYEQEEPDRRKSDRAMWAIARIHRTRGDVNSLAQTYEQWRRKYGRDAGNDDDYVFSYYDTARAYRDKRRTRDAERLERETIDAWKRIGAPTKTRAAELAGEYELEQAERYFKNTWVPLKITQAARNDRQAKEQKERLDQAAKNVQDRYLALDKYGVLDYTMAAKVRYGESLTDYAVKFFEVPTPRHIIALNDKYPDQEVLAKYESQLAARLAPLAGEAKKQWEEVLTLAKQAELANEWSQRARELLNQEFPNEYPVLHQEIIEGTEEP